METISGICDGVPPLFMIKMIKICRKLYIIIVILAYSNSIAITWSNYLIVMVVKAVFVPKANYYSVLMCSRINQNYTGEVFLCLNYLL